MDPLRVLERMRMGILSLRPKLKLGLREDEGRLGVVVPDVDGLGVEVCWRSHCATRLERDGEELAGRLKDLLSVRTGVAGGAGS